jgi:hypothetical protein
MSDSNGQLPKTCGGCRHWNRQKADPRNLGAPAMGECRCMPPAATVIPVQGPGGQQGVMVQSAYPNLPTNAPACGQYAAKVVMAVGGVE